mgnify:FL=1
MLSMNCDKIPAMELENYKIYLNLLEERVIKKHFDEQKPYICCRKGCAHCCKNGEFPLSEIEMEYLMSGYEQLPQDKKNEIKNRIERLISQAKTNKQLRFRHACPFLIDDICCIYEFRPIICRTHGLMFFVEENGIQKNKIPDCAKIGLNYSAVYDGKRNIISDEMWKKSGIKTLPCAYNLSLKTLTNPEITKELGFVCGKSKPLIERFMEF